MTSMLTDQLHTQSTDEPENSAACKSVTRSARQTRILALELYNHQMPDFAKFPIARRWKVPADSVSKILRENGVDPGAEKNCTIPMSDVLRCEQISDPLMAWFSGSLEDREILSAGLLTPEDLCQGLGSLPPMHINSLYRRLKDGRLSSIRIGKQHRFRRTLEGARLWMAEHEETQA